MKNENLEMIRHSFSHVLMHALKRLYGAKPGVGPATENGFYHDFDADYQVKEEDLPKIEEEMKKIIKENLPIKREVMPIDEGIDWLDKEGYVYTKELAEELKKEGESEISFYMQGDFGNMCRGPHVAFTAKLKPGAFKLTKISGAYWKGDEKNKMIQRVYGVAFENKDELAGYLDMLQEAEKRDHRKLGKELDLFSISDKVGPGLILWHPKLAKIREAVEEFWRKFHRQRGYDTIYTPHIGRSALWQTSGHLDFFKESMYSPMDIEGEEYYVKPMNCPFHVEIYKSRPRSWRELPFRWNELGSVYRYEKSGELAGMLRVRGFTQDDAHIICRADQFVDEYRSVLQFTLDMFQVFGFKKEDVRGYIAIRDPKSDKYAGSNEIWEKAEKVVRQVVEEYGIPHEVEEGGAKFYGPALDLKIKDAIGREWQLTTIQLDFNLPEKFDMKFAGPKGDERPIMIHRALLGSLERFFAILIEHYAGVFPVWLSPVQIKLVSVGESHHQYCRDLARELMIHDFRVEVDDNDETVGNKIRKAVGEKIPYILVVGDKEMESNKLAIRVRGSQEAKEMGKEEFIGVVNEAIRNRK